MTTAHTSFLQRSLIIVMMALFAIALPLAPSARADDSSDASSTPPVVVDTSSDDPAPSSPDTTVVTGDADATSDSENDVNTNTALTGDATTTVTDDNDAVVDASTTASADTGDNTASSTGGDTTITTGDAYSTATVLNVINTNIVDSSGLIDFQDFFSALGIDLSGLDLSYFLSPAPDTSAVTDDTSSDCSLSSCPGALTVDDTNVASTSNVVIVTSNTGGNSALSDGGNVSITTGNAYASGNSVNIVNSNIVNSNYLLVGINNFGDLAGDITLPGADFFEQLLANSQSLPADTSVTNDNTATVTTSTTASADTGDNTASSTGGDTTIATGDALSGATSFNAVNTNLLGGTNIYILFRIWGTWNGTIQGLPPGITWQQTPAGIELVGNSGGTPASDTETVTASSTNDATVNSNVQVYALTGANEADGTSGDTSITTGTAEASANSVNVVNTNILGNNWIYAIFNIFGNFTGNISFGQPNLWLGAAAEAPNPTPGGDTIIYTFTVSNLGDADATNVVLNATYPDTLISFADATDTPDGGASTWNLGDIPEGATKSFTYTAHADDIGMGQVLPAPLTATVSSDEDDSDPTNNTDQVSVVIAGPADPYASYSNQSSITYPSLALTKSANVATTTASSTVSYTVDAANSAGAAFDTVLTDILTDPSGDVISNQSWNLDEIDSGDDVKVTYDVNYSSNTTPGAYTNVAELTGYRNATEADHGIAFNPLYATSTVTVVAPAVCVPYLTHYLTPGGASNDAGDVGKLQTFLIANEGETGLTATGVYDAATIAAVERFQQKYAPDILTPWGETAPTGYVYYTTQKEVNDLSCADGTTFPLTDSQQLEISRVHDLILAGLAHPRKPKIDTATDTTTDTEPVVGIATLPALAIDAPTKPANPFDILATTSAWLSRQMTAGVLFAKFFGN